MAKKTSAGKVEFEFQPGGVQAVNMCSCLTPTLVVVISVFTVIALAFILWTGSLIYGAIYDAGKQAGIAEEYKELHKDSSVAVPIPSGTYICGQNCYSTY